MGFFYWVHSRFGKWFVSGVVITLGFLVFKRDAFFGVALVLTPFFAFYTGRFFEEKPTQAGDETSHFETSTERPASQDDKKAA